MSAPVEQRIIAGRYELLAELGRGAMGVVWRAHDRLLGRALALKELHPPTGMSTEDRAVLEERMLREARTAGRLSHASVVTVHDVIVEGGRTFLAMELVNAANLTTIVTRHGPRDSIWVANVALQALGALECAHASGIVHRDVKPSNIMVNPDGGVKLTDFGIAQAMDDPKLTTNGGIVGSPAYMSPDRLSGWEASPASDLWALGATMAYAVEGVSPFERTTTAASLHAVMNESPALYRAIPSLAAVINGLLAVDPARRLSAPKARAMLTEIVNGSMVLPPPRTDKRSGVRTAVAGLAALALVGAGLLAYQWYPKSSAASAAAPALTGVERATAQTSAGPPLPAGKVATFGRGGDVPGWGLGGTQCGKGFLTQGQPVSEHVSCDVPHGIQLYAAATPLWDKPKSVEYPGRQWLAEFAEKYCAEQFQSVRERDALEFTSLVPTDQEWLAWNDTVTPGRQEVLCVLWKRDRSTLDRSVVPG